MIEASGSTSTDILLHLRLGLGRNRGVGGWDVVLSGEGQLRSDTNGCWCLQMPVSILFLRCGGGIVSIGNRSSIDIPLYTHISRYTLMCETPHEHMKAHPLLDDRWCTEYGVQILCAYAVLFKRVN